MVLLFILISCQNKKNGIIDFESNPPYLLNVNLNNYSINIDNDTTSSVDTLGLNKYKIKLIFAGSGHSSGLDNLIRGVIQVFKPSATSPFLTLSFPIEMIGADSVAFDDSLEFSMSRDEAGTFKLSFSLHSGNLQSSDSIEKLFHVKRNNSKPSLLKLTAPDTLARPSSGIKLLFFNVTVNDSDGYADIKDVYMKRIFPTETAPIYLFDDGDLNKYGDKLAGDGVFSRILIIDSTARLGDQVFLFMAEDKTGAVTDSLLHKITIQP